jgi:hypothetical protein
MSYGTECAGISIQALSIPKELSWCLSDMRDLQLALETTGYGHSQCYNSYYSY